MIILKIQGRLGNQMFQYAFAKSLQKRFYSKEEIIINYSKSKYSNLCHFCNKNEFNMKPLKSTYKLHLNLIQLIIFYSYTVIRMILRKEMDVKAQPFLNKFGIYYLQDPGVCDFKKSKFKNKLVFGYFTSEKFFNNVKEEIEREFQLNIPLSKENKKFLKEINSSNSVAISIRRGDYTNKDIANYFLVCEKNYYLEALTNAKKEIKNCRFVVFSDDIDWVKNNIEFPENTLYENKDNQVCETFLLMKSCKHFIISNSTFHWWAQYLSGRGIQSREKIVYAPSIWNNERTRKEIYMKNWKLIDIDRCRKKELR